MAFVISQGCMGRRLSLLIAWGMGMGWAGSAIALDQPLAATKLAPIPLEETPLPAPGLRSPGEVADPLRPSHPPEFLEPGVTASLTPQTVTPAPGRATAPLSPALVKVDPARLPEIPAAPSALAQTSEAPPLDLPPEVIQESPVLQEWLQRTPDIAAEIANDPSFRTRLRLGYSQFPSSGGTSGFNAGVEDVFVWPGTGLTLSGDYARSWDGNREDYGAEARFYVFPLGGIVNFAPVLGYRQLTTSQYSTSGLDVGMRLMIIPSRGGGADVAISQSWVAPGSQDEVGMTAASIGYAVTSHLRLATQLQFQNSRFGQDSHLGLSLEWLL